MREAGAMRGLPDGSAGLPRRGFAPSRNDTGGDGNGRGGRVSAFGRVSLRCHCEPVRAWQSSLRRIAGTTLALLDQILQNLLGQALSVRMQGPEYLESQMTTQSLFVIAIKRCFIRIHYLTVFTHKKALIPKICDVARKKTALAPPDHGLCLPRCACLC